MTGPEHYELAEGIVSRYTAANLDDPGVIAVAQVHATLALAAAVALSCYGETEPEAWDKVAGVQP